MVGERRDAVCNWANPSRISVCLEANSFCNSTTAYKTDPTVMDSRESPFQRFSVSNDGNQGNNGLLALSLILLKIKTH